MRYDTPLGSGVPGSVSASDQLAALPVREQVRKGFREMGRATYSSAKNFSKIGALVAGSECCIESVSECFPGSPLALVGINVDRAVSTGHPMRLTVFLLAGWLAAGWLLAAGLTVLSAD